MILVADEIGARVKYSEGQLVLVDKDDRVLSKAELVHTEEVVLIGAVGISGPAIEAIVANGIDLYYVAYDGEPAARLVPDGSTFSELRLAQYRARCDEPQRLQYAKEFIAGKLHHQRVVLQRAFRTWPGDLDLVELERVIASVATVSDLPALLGLEGAGARAYFEQVRRLIPQAWGFTARKRRPPPDPINSMLSFAYAYVGNLVTRAVRAARLDPYLGLLHDDREGRPSLALDLLEEFRPITADAAMIRAVRQHIVGPDDFEMIADGNCRMTEQGRAKFIRTLETRLAASFEHPSTGERCDFRKATEVQARSLAKALLGQAPSYHALRLR